MNDEQQAKDEYGMRLALDQAHNALLVGEVPVGAVILRLNLLFEITHFYIQLNQKLI